MRADGPTTRQEDYRTLRVIQPKTPDSRGGMFVAASFRSLLQDLSQDAFRAVRFRIRELSIGVSVKLTSMETNTENAIVQPN